MDKKIKITSSFDMTQRDHALPSIRVRVIWKCSNQDGHGRRLSGEPGRRLPGIGGVGKSEARHVKSLHEFLLNQLNSVIELVGVTGDHSMDITDLADGTTIAECLHRL